jgi:hypothetical protein
MKGKNPALAMVKVSEYAFDGLNGPETVALILGQRTITPNAVQPAKNPATSFFVSVHATLGSRGGGFDDRCFFLSLSFLDLDIYVSIPRPGQSILAMRVMPDAASSPAAP